MLTMYKRIVCTVSEYFGSSPAPSPPSLSSSVSTPPPALATPLAPTVAPPFVVPAAARRELRHALYLLSSHALEIHPASNGPCVPLVRDLLFFLCWWHTYKLMLDLFYVAPHTLSFSLSVFLASTLYFVIYLILFAFIFYFIQFLVPGDFIVCFIRHTHCIYWYYC
jgi:hypothetical protein